MYEIFTIVSSVFQTYVASALSGCGIYLQWFLSVFHMFSISVSDEYFKCLICIFLCCKCCI
jgi:hypothetical protein